jgi:hypothetical protein
MHASFTPPSREVYSARHDEHHKNNKNNHAERRNLVTSSRSS